MTRPYGYDEGYQDGYEAAELKLEAENAKLLSTMPIDHRPLLGRIDTLEAENKALKDAVTKLMTHRDVPCTESVLHQKECPLLDHQHLVCRTAESRDDLYALAALTKEEL